MINNNLNYPQLNCSLMAEKGGTGKKNYKIIISVISILLIFMIIASFFLFVYYTKISFKYELKIEYYGNSDYELYLPLIISEDKINLLVNKSNNPKIENGKGEIKIINTNYGYAYHIKSNESLLIKCSKEYYVAARSRYEHYLLSLENKNEIDWTGDTQYWCFSNHEKANNSIEIKANFNHVVKSGFLFKSTWHTKIDFNGRLSDGWNLINATKRTIVD